VGVWKRVLDTDDVNIPYRRYSHNRYFSPIASPPRNTYIALTFNRPGEEKLLKYIGIALLFITPPVNATLPGHPQQIRPQKDAGRSGAPDPAAKPILHISLIGDAGNAGPDNDAPIEAIGRAAKEITAPELTIYLGDNVYPNGMPPAGDGDRARAEGVLDTQLKIFGEDTSMAGLFIPGNHDWDGMGDDGRASVMRQADYIREATHSRIPFLPDSAGPGPVLVVRNDVLQVIALDSQWWLHHHDKPHYPWAPTDSATKAAVADSLNSLLYEFDGKISVVLAHHPLETYGPHGGYFPWEDHIFPLRNVVPWLWLPLPVIGSAYPLLRTTGYSEQDLSNREYLDYIRQISRAVNAAVARGKGPVFFASGHEHDLQVLQPKEDFWCLVSGNGMLDHASALSDGPNTVFASEEAGYMTLDVFENGGVMLKVIGVEKQEGDPEVLFEKWIPPKGE
jgi:hypothetical protein